ncbi:MAG: type IV-A pilus assembly ATPase PilB [Gammaproteobacteria bacterium]|nr:type IV-A pilus assembly ATPase PilB [Gammaproteobacteria bacterium]
MLSKTAHSLIKHRLLGESEALQATQQVQYVSLVHWLVQYQQMDATQIAHCLAQEFNITIFDLDTFDLHTIPQNINQLLIEKHRVLPLFTRDKQLHIAVSDPQHHDALQTFRFHTGLISVPVLVEDDKLHQAIERYLNHFEKNHLAVDAEENLSARLSTVRLVNQIIERAVQQKASDIHFEPYENSFRIRYRRDGVLYKIKSPPMHLAKQMISRLKIMANLDISEQRLPQDGRFKLTIIKQAISFRINTCPTLFGEKIVLRILDPTIASMGIEALGFSEAQQQLFLDAMHKTQGMILVTGPTGSGKTVTQYSALNILNTEQRNISTVEDPVEIYLPGINQVNVNSKINLSFSTALRAFLRQDPDVIMVGEIRDKETADIAMKAAQTGHLVLSTLHTNSAADTLTRLMNIGVAPFTIAASLSLVIAQRLARRLCEHCKTPAEYATTKLLAIGFGEEHLNTLQLFNAKGCQHCLNGYSGRIGIYEMLPINDIISEAILQQTTSKNIAQHAQQQGFLTLQHSALQKMQQGLTSLEEVTRIL